MSMPWSVFLADEAATMAAGAQLANICAGHGLFTLKGNLGGGKTTFCRGLIQALGHKGAVKSPTYTLVEPYELGDLRILHYDLYRLADPDELEYLGMRDFLDDQTLTLVEWPQMAGELLPAPDLALELSVEAKSRRLHCSSHTPRGHALSKKLQDCLQNHANT